mgnify:CR=1 FL=1
MDAQMERLQIDTGVQEFQINDGGILRFNPSDPNVYNRFFTASEDIRKIDDEIAKETAAIQDGDNEGMLNIMKKADEKVKALLNDIFGLDNDFNQILGGINLLATGKNGKQVIINLLDALMPIFESGIKKSADEKLASAKMNREQRRAMNKK